jgi:hypothetical protein
MKDKPQNRRGYLQIIYLIRDLYPKYLRTLTQNSTTKTNNSVFKTGKVDWMCGSSGSTLA